MQAVADEVQLRITDTNPLAPFPSLHVALPAAIANWLFRVRMQRRAVIFSVYVALTAFDVSTSGSTTSWTSWRACCSPT